MDDSAEVFCPHCGEPGTIEVTPDASDDEFVQDCAVCCRPWRVRFRIAPDGSVQVTVTADE